MKVRLHNYITYFSLVFVSNLASILIILTASKNPAFGFLSNLIYELSAFCAIYVGVKKLTILELLIVHIIASTSGYVLAQFINSLI